MIRPFQPGDIYLIQRLSRQATQFPCAHTFLHRQSSMSVTLSAILPWTTTKASTYVLRQDGHGLVHEGYLQVIRRQSRPEAELLCLAPSLDAPTGHPAIWNKLLSHLIHTASALGFERIYADVPDQPLLVNTFAAVGFQPYCRQTIWRCFEPDVTPFVVPNSVSCRPRTGLDDWTLLRLYTATVPQPVQIAEGVSAEAGAPAPILENLRPDQGVTYLVFSAGVMVGALQLQHGRHGSWLQIWADTLQQDTLNLRLLIGQASMLMRENQWPAPLYVAASDFHGGLPSVLDDFAFAPFRDRVRMVKHVVKWVRESVSNSVPVVETTSEVVPTSFAPPSGVSSSIHSSTTIDSGSVV